MIKKIKNKLWQVIGSLTLNDLFSMVHMHEIALNVCIRKIVVVASLWKIKQCQKKQEILRVLGVTTSDYTPFLALQCWIAYLERHLTNDIIPFVLY
jgi:hypothetical protein